jgi:molybdopterin-guanine dinucleotide biosynthesis protein A
MVACDMPGLSVDFLRKLVDAAENCDADVLAPVGPSGRLEPLCAVYHQRSRQGLYGAFARGERKMAAALEGVRTVALPVLEVLHFQNVNTPEDWSSYAG